MNIHQAKEQIRNTILAYLEKDSFGNYEIPVEEQRPVFLIGAPGIGKTAIMKQLSQELGIGLVSYSMTHHTRQSALGLPFITERNYGGDSFMVSEYTMSEIIASVYNSMELSGLSEGILFLDEINCVSETLLPSMLQFLQFKTFGGHRVPGGWVIITAGNPPEYNRNVHQLDVVTMDRLKRIDVEPDYSVWKDYALARNIHPSILSYLEIKRDHFYSVESTTSGKIFVTARGWMDLSQMLRIYEKRGLVPDRELVIQYLQHPKIARDFAAYYDLFRKYQADYEVPNILAGKAGDAIRLRAKSASFDERLALLGLLIDALTHPCEEIIAREALCLSLSGELRELKAGLERGNRQPAAADVPAHANSEPVITAFLEHQIRQSEEALLRGSKAGSLSEDQKALLQRKLRFYQETGSLKTIEALLGRYQQEVQSLRNDVSELSGQFEHGFSFLEDVYPNSQEMLIFVTELTVHPKASLYISHYGCPGYFRHNKELLFYERNKEIIRELQELDL